MSFRPILSFAALALLSACPDSSGTETDAGSSTNGGSTSDAVTTTDEPTTGSTTTDDMTPGSTTGSTTDDTTTGSMPGATRILYAVVAEGTSDVVAVRSVEIVDGVAGAPVTLLEAPEGARFGEYDLPEAGKPHAAVQSYGAGPKRLWLLDAASAHEVSLPGAYDILYVNFSADRKHLIVGGGPQDLQPGDLEFSVCEIGADGACALQVFAPSLAPMTYLSYVFDVSPADGRLLYQTRTLDDSNTEVLLGDLAGIDAALVAASADPALTPTLAPDAKTVYLRDATQQNFAVDVSADVPGPLVPLHAPLADLARPTWDPSMSHLLVWNGAGVYGDLHHVAVDGAMPGPLQTFNAGAPMHVQAKSAKFSPDGARVGYLADHETPDDTQLYVSEIADVAAPPSKINGALAPGGSVTSGFTFLADGQRMLYAARLDQFPDYHVFLARLDQPGTVMPIGPAPEHAILTVQLLPSHDGERFLYLGGLGPAVAELLLVDIAGDQPSAPLSLSSALPVGTLPTLNSAFAADDSAVFFRAAADGAAARLYMIAIAPDVGTPAAISAAGESVQRFVVLP
ncbi:hypothetical protein [Nannocystis punicea]|uniref:WD40-like Beta Propeller Repeat n=1 Tax=Nannocystis punicea TaxID=2995304 RepID=A0ABY7HBJ7_9BACT|nr:hypothetical protein [Nannocystis poenicansa]WAS96642.1 hypothetical protein O0S08_10850 [Nannocystis poenicansa]